MTAEDAKAIKNLSYVDSVTPSLNNSLTVRYDNEAVTASVEGYGRDYFRVKGYEIAQGQFWQQDSVDALAQDAVIDDNTRKSLFTDKNPIGQVIFFRSIAGTHCRCDSSERKCVWQ